VKIVNDDARSFFATTSEKYDIISFGLFRLAHDNFDDNARAGSLCVYQGEHYPGKIEAEKRAAF